jgi:endoglucanase
VQYQKNKGWQLKQDKALVGSYDAIRVLWVGMMSDKDPQKARLLARFQPMAAMTTKQGVPPEKVDVATGNVRAMARSVFLPHAAFLQNVMPRRFSASVADHFPDNNAYYSYVLTLFGQGWDQHRFRFTAKGELIPDWGQECASSH